MGYVIAEHLSARQQIQECSEISTLVCTYVRFLSVTEPHIYIYIYICGSVTLRKRTTTGTLIRRSRVLLMALL